MALSVYIHIPYCLQRCRYCDFTTFEWSQIVPPEQYVSWLRQEIRNRHQGLFDRSIRTIYFGGGTPSLLDAELIISILEELNNAGFRRTDDCEVTIEINPATMDQEKLEKYLRAGINRFSVGAQSFHDSLLKDCGRKHSAQETRETLSILKNLNLNYSFDLLFALPHQTLDMVKQDVEEALSFQPHHLSAYCLTVPEGHPMSFGRAPEDEQVQMFDWIETRLAKNGLYKYEISNFARPGFESQHNMAYWSDRSYWGLGLSAHSYFPDAGPFGTRFWNPKSLDDYKKQTQILSVGRKPFELLPPDQKESLLEHEALTDFCHMFLRTATGLPKSPLNRRFYRTATLAEKRLKHLVTKDFLSESAQGWSLTTKGQMLSNQVFAELLFCKEDLHTWGAPALTSGNLRTY